MSGSAKMNLDKNAVNKSLFVAFSSYLAVYLDSSDMRKLAEIPHAALGIFKNMDVITLSKR